MLKSVIPVARYVLSVVRPVPRIPFQLWMKCMWKPPDPSAVMLIVAARLDSSGATLNRDEVDRLYRAMWPAFQTDVPVAFLQPVVFWTVARRRVGGLGRPDVLDPASAVEELWIEEDSP